MCVQMVVRLTIYMMVFLVELVADARVVAEGAEVINQLLLRHARVLQGHGAALDLRVHHLLEGLAWTLALTFG